MAKKMTEAEKKAFGKRMAEARAAKKKAAEIKESPPQITPDSDIERQVKELKANQEVLEALLRQSNLETPHLSSRGRMVGTFEKYITDPNHYPDPTERLAAEDRLKSFAFNENYELTWKVTRMLPYETIDGIMQTEPKFFIELIRKHRDEETGEISDKRYKICDGTFFEDPESAVVVAKDHGIDVDSMDERRFLDEMRYLRIRDWLFDAFFPPRAQQKKNEKEEVIGNRLVKVWETSSTEPESYETISKTRPKAR